MNKGIIKVNTNCNNNCLFCHSKTKSNLDSVDFNEICNKVLSMKKKGVKQILLSGGECTIHPNFFKVLEFIKLKKLEIGLITNGRFFHNKEFIDKIKEYDIKYVHTSIHGLEETHDAITNVKGSYSQVFSCIKYCLDNNIELEVNCVAVKKNILELSQVAELLNNYKISNLTFSFIEPFSFSKDEIPMIKDFSDRLKQIFALNLSLNITFDNIPLCLSQGFEEKRYNLLAGDVNYISESFEKNIFESDHGNKAKIPKCLNCSKKDSCEGVFKLYIDYFGDNEFSSFD